MRSDELRAGLAAGLALTTCGGAVIAAAARQSGLAVLLAFLAMLLTFAAVAADHDAREKDE